MTTTPVHSITDEQIAELESHCQKFHGFAITSQMVMQMITRLREAEKDAARMEWLEKVSGLRIERENSIWYDIDGGSYISTHMLCANGTQFSGLRNLRIAIDTAMQGDK